MSCAYVTLTKGGVESRSGDGERERQARLEKPKVLVLFEVNETLWGWQRLCKHSHILTLFLTPGQ